MVSEMWLRASLVLPKIEAETPAELVRSVCDAIEGAGGPESSTIRASVEESLAYKESYSVGKGVALPHTEAAGLSGTFVCLVTTRGNLGLAAIDGLSPDIFFFIVARPGPTAHLLLLAHLARLCHSHTFLHGLRGAETVDEILALAEAAEKRISLSLPPRAARPSAGELVFLTVSGEKAVDALLVELVDQGFAEATLVEAQTLREATAHEVPLFAGFRDLFGDPGGRRVLLLESNAERTEAVLEAVQRVSSEYEDSDLRVMVLPVSSHWAAHKNADPEHPER